MLEVEIKAYCDNLKDVDLKIVALGGRKTGERVERDSYFNHPSRDFGNTDEALRIRVTDAGGVLTYKGPKIGTRSKTRFEEEVNIDSPASMRLILEKLGFAHVDDVVKKRTLYRLGDIEICLDEVEGAGSFVELEKKDMDKDAAEKMLFELAERLGLDRFERRSYLELKMSKKQTT